MTVALNQFPNAQAQSRRMIASAVFADRIIDEECELAAIPRETVMRRTHKPAIAAIRWRIFDRMLRELQWSFPMIGKHFHMHHTSVMYGICRHRGRTAIEIKSAA